MKYFMLMFTTKSRYWSQDRNFYTGPNSQKKNVGYIYYILYENKKKSDLHGKKGLI